MKKGFTLIELLAVILILGVIALIAVPIVNNVIEDSKKHAAEVTAMHYIKSINDQNALYKLQPDKFTPITSGDVEDIEVNLKGEGPTEGEVTIENGKVTEAELCANGYTVTYNGITTTVEGKCGSVSSCTAEDMTFSYTGGVQTYTVTCTGTYKLEVWGAQGGSADETYHGGYGGYSTGTVKLNKNKNTTLYVVVGGAGTYGSSTVAGGYNGGGNSYGYSANTSSGGGATHIATETGVLSSLESNQGSILIVAGGGGGSYKKNSSNYGYGGAGGGTTGLGSSNVVSERSQIIHATGGTQNSGGTYGIYYNSSYKGLGELSNGSFGQGGTNQSTGDDRTISGGGGGFYGGGAAYQGPAAGGSSYIGGVTNGQTIDGDSSMPTHDGTSTMTGNTGNGYAKITYLGK